jgi:hypothetical protein
MGHLDQLRDNEILNDRYLEQYRRDSGVLGDELVYLHSNLRLLSQLRQFPAGLDTTHIVHAFRLNPSTYPGPIRHKTVNRPTFPPPRQFWHLRPAGPETRRRDPGSPARHGHTCWVVAGFGAYGSKWYARLSAPDD